MGLGRGDRLAIVLPNQPARLLRVASDPHEASHWQLVSFPVAEDYPGALAVRATPSLQIRYLEKDP
jgi:hypothetical protein